MLIIRTGASASSGPTRSGQSPGTPCRQRQHRGALDALQARLRRRLDQSDIRRGWLQGIFSRDRPTMTTIVETNLRPTGYAPRTRSIRRTRHPEHQRPPQSQSPSDRHDRSVGRPFQEMEVPNGVSRTVASNGGVFGQRARRHHRANHPDGRRTP
jgi:hypothetical protein